MISFRKDYLIDTSIWYITHAGVELTIKKIENYEYVLTLKSEELTVTIETDKLSQDSAPKYYCRLRFGLICAIRTYNEKLKELKNDK